MEFIYFKILMKLLLSIRKQLRQVAVVQKES